MALAAQQTPARPPPADAAGASVADARDAVTPAQLAAAIDKLGTIDFTERMAAARTPAAPTPAMAVPALLKAVGIASGRLRALPRARAALRLQRSADARRHARGRSVCQNDRLRAVAYTYFEHNPDPTIVPKLLAAVADGVVRVRAARR